jgi:nicotinate-nucleotide pyrophosphorylase (carboxylating)
MTTLTPEEIRRSVQAALKEDVGAGDITTLATIPAEARARALVMARESLVVAGLPLAEATFLELGPGSELVRDARDGENVTAGQTLIQVFGAARAILTAERVALNFLQRLSGIATLTQLFADAVKGTRAKILDTRKTTPGMRRLEKYAVECGGGQNHRQGLDDHILIKDNHLAVLRDAPPNPVAAAIARAREKYPGRKVEVEADTLDQVDQALEAGADIILLDNMNLVQLRVAVQQARGRALTEASGGVNLANVRQIAETGVDYISVGAITHSAPAVDIALDFQQ